MVTTSHLDACLFVHAHLGGFILEVSQVGCAAVEQSHKAGPPLALCLAESLVSPARHASGVIKTKHH